LHVVSTVGEVGHGHPKEPVKSGRMEVSGEHLESAVQDEFGATIRARSHDNCPRGEVLGAGLADTNHLAILQIELEDLFGTCGYRVNHNAARYACLTLLEVANVIVKRANGRGRIELH
jgi:hypothetical protein